MHEFDSKAQKQFDDAIRRLAEAAMADPSAKERIEQMMDAKTKEIIRESADEVRQKMEDAEDFVTKDVAAHNYDDLKRLQWYAASFVLAVKSKLL